VTGPLLGPAARAAATRADRRAQLDDGLVELACRRCGGRVRAGKRSEAHTSIQWTADATRRCSAYTIAQGCPHLRAALDDLAVDLPGRTAAEGDDDLPARDELAMRGG
jgi:hypothetical protein